METSILIRRHIFALPADVIFTTRDLLSYGSRASIDQTLYRYVKSQVIVRLARGVFVRPKSAVACNFSLKSSATGEFTVGKKVHSVLEIAHAKAKAFGREIAKCGKDIACQFGWLDEALESNQRQKRHDKEFVFSVSGRTSSFRIGDVSVRLQGVCKRKMQLTESQVGQYVLALWTLGKFDCLEFLDKATKQLTRKDRHEIRSIARHVPGWLLKNWVTCQYNYVSLPKLAESFT